MGREGRIQNEMLNEEMNSIEKIPIQIKKENKINEENSVINNNNNIDKVIVYEQKFSFFNAMSSEKRNNISSNLKILSPTNKTYDKNKIRDNLSPKNLFKNYNYYKNLNSKNILKIPINNTDNKFKEINLKREKINSNNASSNKLITNIYKNLNRLSLKNVDKATYADKKRIMSSSPATNPNSTQISINKISFNSSLNKYHHLFNYQRKSFDINKNFSNFKDNQLNHLKNYSYDNNLRILSPKATYKNLRPFSASNQKNNSKTNSLFSLKKNKKKEITKANKTKEEKVKIKKQAINQNKLSEDNYNYKSSVNRLMTSYTAENINVYSYTKKKELNYVNFLDNLYNNPKTENTSVANKDLSIAVTEIDKLKNSFTENNSNIKSNNRYIITYKDKKNPVVVSNNATSKVTNFTFGKSNSKQTKEASINLIIEKINKNNKISKSISKNKEASNKLINVEYSKKIKIISNIQSPILARNPSSRNSNMISPNRNKNSNINSSLKKKKQMSFIKTNKNLYSKYAFASRNFNSEIINKVKNKQFVSYTPPNDNNEHNSEEDEKVKEEILPKLNNLELLNSLKLAIVRKLKLHSKTSSKEISNGSSQLFVPIELQNSVKNSDISVYKHNIKDINKINLAEVNLKQFSNSENSNDNLQKKNENSELKLDSDNFSIKRNSFIDYKLTYLSNNSQNIESSTHNRCFSADAYKNQSLTKEFIRNKYKDVLNYYLSEPNSLVCNFYV